MLVETPRPLQVVGIDPASSKFELHEDDMNSILNKVPADMKVSIVSVVGAFRTGKSFLLSLFLRFLRHGSNDVNEVWMSADGPLMGGNENSTTGEASGPMSFGWRGGKERNTTGIWMWSEPFIRTTASGEDIAVLLVDTQGMFDNETTMGLTACIFGLSTLLSSYQIYNVDKQIQEDNLQHLALFTEYGRMALRAEGQDDSDDEEQTEEVKGSDGAAASTTAAAATAAGGEAGEATPTTPSTTASVPAAAVAATTAAGGATGAAAGVEVQSGEETLYQEAAPKRPVNRPFQKLEFLVRDWQNFDDDESMEEMKNGMSAYLQEVLTTRHGDLKDTREQIHSCFTQLSCWLLPHPGFEVPKKSYDGAVAKIRQEFRTLLDAYCRHVFCEQLEPKRVHGRPVTVSELGVFMSSYAKLFEKGDKFPEAKTLLAATAEANNHAAADAAMRTYKKEMDKLAGPGTKYVKAESLEAHHVACKEGALSKFDSMANMGRRTIIAACRARVQRDMTKEHAMYTESNDNKNPFRNLEYYMLPMAIGLMAVVLRTVADATCSEYSDVCREASHAFGHVYIVIFTFLLIMASSSAYGAWDHLKQSPLFSPLLSALGVSVDVPAPIVAAAAGVAGKKIGTGGDAAAKKVSGASTN